MPNAAIWRRYWQSVAPLADEIVEALPCVSSVCRASDRVNKGAVEMRMGLVVSLLMAASLVTPASAMTKTQAQKQCRAEYSTFDAEKRRSRTGLSFEQDMAFCIKQKLRR